MKKIKLPLVLAACLCAGTFAPSFAQDFDFDNIDSLLEENTLTDASSRYRAVLQNYLPERATRLGFTSSAGQLNTRTPEAQKQLQRALESAREKLQEIRPANLSAAKKLDFMLLQNALETDLQNAATARTAADPLYYAGAFDALYDVYLNPAAGTARKRADLASRISSLPALADLAEKNLTNPAPFLALLATEKAYYAYLSFDELSNFLIQGAQDEVTLAQTQADTRNAKRAVKRMFDLFKRLSQAQNGPDFRMGEKPYADLLARQYQITDSPAKLVKSAEANTRTARRNFSAALTPFLASAAPEEEITLVESLNGNLPPASKKSDKKKKQKQNKPVERSAQDFYAVAKRVLKAQPEADYAAALKKQAAAWATQLTRQNILPAPAAPFAVSPMPQYYTYTRAAWLRPSYTGGTPELFLRMPAGNALARKKQLQTDFNTPALKVLAAKELLGGYYQNAAGKNWSVWRQAYPSATTANGWKEYAAELAKENALIVTDEELAYLAWDNYRRALAAEIDVKLQTKRFSYADALNYLTQENGFEQADAENMIKAVAQHPAEALSRQYGLETWLNTREKFRKKLGKKFNMADFHKKALQTGNIPPAELEKEISRLYEKDKKKKKDWF